MSLQLKVVSLNDQPVAEPQSGRFDAEGGTIGRSAECTLRLQDPERIVSSRHAEVFFQGGHFFITDTSTNGLYVNTAATPLGRGNSVRVSHNDRFRLGGYVLVAEVGAQSATGLDDTEARQPAGAEEPPAPSDPLAGIPGAGGLGPDDDLGRRDVLEALGAPPAGATGPAPPGPIGAQDRPPPDELLPQENPLIPDDFGLDTPAQGPLPGGAARQHSDSAPILSSHFEVARAVPEAADQPPAPPRGRQVIPQDWDAEAPADGSAGETPIPIPPAAPAAAEAPQPIPPPPEAAGAARGEPESPFAGEAAAPRAAASPLGHGRGADDRFVRTVLDALGLARADLDEATRDAVARNLGAGFRELVKGVVEILAERGDFKSEFRLDVTRLRPAENNPLKFSTGIEQTLEQLLTEKAAGLMPTPQAVREAFDDLRAHHLAVMAGITASLSALLTQLDPKAIERESAAGGILDSMLPAARHAKCWEQFVHRYGAVAEDAAEGFRRLFADAFARAYEDQVQRLIQARDRGS